MLGYTFKNSKKLAIGSFLIAGIDDLCFAVMKSSALDPMQLDHLVIEKQKSPLYAGFKMEKTLF